MELFLNFPPPDTSSILYNEAVDIQQETDV
jgi:hypothetical protein